MARSSDQGGNRWRIPNEDLVREGYAAFGQGDLDMLSNRFFADGVRWHLPGRSPFGGDYTGIGEVMTWLGRSFEASGGTIASSCTTSSGMTTTSSR